MLSQHLSEQTTAFPQLLNVNSFHSVVTETTNGHTEGMLGGGCRTGPDWRPTSGTTQRWLAGTGTSVLADWGHMLLGQRPQIGPGRWC